MNSLIFQGQIGHALHVFLPGKNRADGSKAKGTEKEQQCDDTEPLDALDGLKQVFVHDECVLVIDWLSVAL